MDGNLDVGYEIQIDPEQKLVRFTADGSFTRDDFFNCVHEVVAREDYQPDFDILVDLTQVEEFGADGADIRVRAESDQASLGFGNCRIALVATKPLIFGMTRMYQILLQAPNVRVETFQDMEEARRWLGIK